MSCPSSPPHIDICDLFASLQGEGGWVGTPMLFVRFWGCPLHCPFCDEPRHRDPAARRSLSLSELLGELRQTAPQLKRVVLTGGEPLAASGVAPLVAALKEAGYWIAMESSGVGGAVPEGVDWLTLSPKGPLPAGLLQRADEIKYIVGSDLSPAREQEILAQGERHPLVWVQPMACGDRLDDAATARCIALVQAGAGRLRLSMQTHKLLGLP